MGPYELLLMVAVSAFYIGVLVVIILLLVRILKKMPPNDRE